MQYYKYLILLFFVNLNIHIIEIHSFILNDTRYTKNDQCVNISYGYNIISNLSTPYLYGNCSKNNKIIKLKEKDNNNNHLKIALCAIGKNENPYIREWVEWYKNIGISNIFLYDNNELNGERFEEVIHDYIKNDFVKIIDRRGKIINIKRDDNGNTIQGEAYHNCYYNNYKNYDWIFFFDIDEFLIIDYKYGNIFEFLNDFNEYDGIKIQWRMYGDNGMLYYENKSVIERFQNKNNVGYDKFLKSILKCKEYKFELLFCAHGILNKEPYIVNVNKKRVRHKYKDSKAYKNLPVYLNHFYSKSTEEYIKRKFNKTSAISGINYSRNFSLKFLKNNYYKFNKITEEKERMFNSLKI